MPLSHFRGGNPPPNRQNMNSFGQPNWLNTGKTVLRGIQQVMPYLSQAGVPIPPVVNFLMKGMGAGGYGGNLNNTLNVQPSYQPLSQAQVQPQAQTLQQQSPQTFAKGGGIKALISNFLARRKG
ncbi:hypothetical protein [Desulfitobacterium metallireducens]|uniref:Uncharacterized protein n=1 Tax=Desulfitobacterium metallireducens DSM 15288 TaxID=871968 RepID=W0EGS2_9FIRM|nr:hypothetical protein [Desulfitobacterium metallireducens]AHF08693.1 hypothetical protein DESME_14655 [Desulfitobacterium metallireducens DSM 15288]